MLIYLQSEGSPCEGALARFFRKWRPASLAMRPRVVDWAIALTIASTLLVVSQTAHAHGIAGNRLFPGTLSFDDPAVADEATLPITVSIGRFPGFSRQMLHSLSTTAGFIATGASGNKRVTVRQRLNDAPASSWRADELQALGQC